MENATFGYTSRFGSLDELNDIQVGNNCINISRAFISQYGWGTAITTNIDNAYLFQTFLGELAIVKRKCNLADRTWSNFTN